MQYTLDNCKKCGEEKPIVNKKYYLCNDCNHIRLHGESYEEKQKKKEFKNRHKLTTADKLKPKKNKKPLKQRTDKQKEYEEKLRKSYEEFDQIMIDNDSWYCRGCGKAENLSHSHIIRQSWCKNNNLEYLCFDHRNITLHCLSSCHQKWESGVIEWMVQLNDFWYNLEFIRTISEQEYQKIYQKLLDKNLV